MASVKRMSEQEWRKVFSLLCLYTELAAKCAAALNEHSPREPRGQWATAGVGFAGALLRGARGWLRETKKRTDAVRSAKDAG